MKDYTVIVYPPPPATRGGDQAVYSQSTKQGPRVTTVRQCRSPKEAADKADVQPGGRCVVVVDGRIFRRAEKAPLTELGDDLAPLPMPA